MQSYCKKGMIQPLVSFQGIESSRRLAIVFLPGSANVGDGIPV